MAAISRKNDTVFSPDGVGYNCGSSVITSVDEVNSNKVYINNILAVVFGNKVAPHPKSGCSTDESTLSTCSDTVFIISKGVGRIGDAYGNNIITSGSADVFANWCINNINSE